MKEKNCGICGKEYKVRDNTKGRRRVTCGDSSCASKAAYQANKSLIKDCRICGKKTKVKMSASKLPTYCSKRCRNKRYKHICVICGIEFRNSKVGTLTCSQRCRTKYIRMSKVTINCAYCLKDFERPSYTYVEGRRHYCTKRCRDNYFSKQRDAGRYVGSWERHRNQRLEFDGYKCLACGIRQHDPDLVRLEVHHIIPVKKFADPRDAHYQSNLRTLCSGCHHKVEYGKIECP